MHIMSVKKAVRISLGAAFLCASSLHFISDIELKIIPPFLPWRRAALYITGALEVLGGIGLFIPRVQRAAAWGLAALLVVVYPANVYHAINRVKLGGVTDAPLYHWIRLPMQGVMIWLTLWSTSKQNNREK